MTDPTVPAISVEQLRLRLADPYLRWWLIHATDAAPFHEGHIPGALARPHDAALRQLADGVPVVVYGEDERARAAPALAADLRREGVEVAWFTGGLAAWAAARQPIERSG